MKKKLASIIIVLAMAFTFWPTMPSNAAVNFQDIQGHWAQSLINQFVQDGYIVGRSDTVFAPDAPMLRSEFATLALRVFPQLAALPTVTPTVSTQDVSTYTATYSGTFASGDIMDASLLTVTDMTTEAVVDPSTYTVQFGIPNPVLYPSGTPLWDNAAGNDVTVLITDTASGTTSAPITIGTVDAVPTETPTETPTTAPATETPTETPTTAPATDTPAPATATTVPATPTPIVITQPLTVTYTSSLAVPNSLDLNAVVVKDATGATLTQGVDYTIDSLDVSGYTTDPSGVSLMNGGLLWDNAIGANVNATITTISDSTTATFVLGPVVATPTETPTAAPATATPTAAPATTTPTTAPATATATPTATPLPVGLFTDVPTTHWAYSAINTMASVGILQGYGDGTFHPDSYITRQDAAVIVNRILTDLGMSAPVGAVTLTDASTISPYAQVAVLTLTNLGIITGYPDSTFRPFNTITRAEVVAMMSRALAKYNTAFATPTPTATLVPTTAPTAAPTAAPTTAPTTAPPTTAPTDVPSPVPTA